MRHPGPHAAAIRARHRKHALLVLAVLSKEGVPPAEVEEAAQEVWATVHQKLVAGEPEPDSWPAYLTTLAQGRAVNHRRAARHRRAVSLADEPGVLAGRLSAEQVVILYSLIDSIPNPDQREAVRLQAQGYTIKEIAEKQGITEAGVKKRLKMAGEHLEKELDRDDDEKGDEGEKKEKAGAFWGFGSFEALIDALSEERERQWKGIEEAIREIESPPEPPSPSDPKIAAPLSLLIPNATPALAPAVAKWTLLAALGGAILGGAYLGARKGAEHEVVPLACPEPPASTTVPPQSGLPPQSPLPAGTMAARPAPSSATRPAARAAAAPDDLEDLLLREKEDSAGVGR
jgi:RNA polymerase sigma factor (sigma-70 family)